MLQLANDASYFTSQKLTLLAHGIAARQSQIVFSARKFDGEIKVQQKIVPEALDKRLHQTKCNQDRVMHFLHSG